MLRAPVMPVDLWPSPQHGGRPKEYGGTPRGNGLGLRIGAVPEPPLTPRVPISPRADGGRVRTLGPMLPVKPLLQSPKPFTPLMRTRQTVLTTVQLAGREPGPRAKGPDQMKAEMGFAMRNIASLQARQPPPPPPTHVRLGQNQQGPNSDVLEVEGHTDWWKKKKRPKPKKTAADASGEPAVELSHQAQVMRGLLDAVEECIHGARGGMLGVGLERRDTLTLLADNASDSGFLVTLGRAIERLRVVAEQLQPDDSEVEVDWQKNESVLNVKEEAARDADMLQAFSHDLLTSDEELKEYSEMIGEQLSVRQQQLRQQAQFLEVDSARVNTVGDHISLLELAGVYVDQGRLGAVVEIIAHLNQILQFDPQGRSDDQEGGTAASDAEDIAEYINETVGRWQKLQEELLMEDPTIFDRVMQFVLEEDRGDNVDGEKAGAGAAGATGMTVNWRKGITIVENGDSFVVINPGSDLH